MAKVSTVMVLRAVAIVHRAHEHDNHWDAVALGFITLFRELDPDFDEASFRDVVHMSADANREWSK